MHAPPGGGGSGALGEHGAVAQGCAHALGSRLRNLHLALPVALLRLQLVLLGLLADVVHDLRHLGGHARLRPELLVLLPRSLLLLHDLVEVLLGLVQHGLPLLDLLFEELRLCCEAAQLLLHAAKALDRAPALALQVDELLVGLLDPLQELLVLDLKLVEVDVLQIVACLRLGLQLHLGLLDRDLVRLVLHEELVYQHVLLRELVLHVLQDLLRHRLASPGVLGADHDVAAELVGISLDLRGPDVSLLHQRPQDVQVLLGRLLGLLDVLHEGLHLLVGDPELLL
mmetsp:Transcript_30943/g.96274  ORF Transcript_30943/g.96274 Transcript_30943/m.96274 type:complete len:284 (-) Transcript_30943:175-1026(-)